MPQFISNFAQIERLPGAENSIGQFSFDTANNNFIFSGPDNIEISDPTIDSAWGIGGFGPNFKHKFGNTTDLPTTEPTDAIAAGYCPNWSADSGYPGNAVVCSAIGGYDTIVNQTGGGTVMANHCIVKYSLDGHGVIVGGSVCVYAGDRGAIISSLECDVAPGATGSAIITSRRVNQSGDYGAVIACNESKILGSYESAISSFDVVTTGSGSRNVAIAANNCDITGVSQYNLLTGLNNTIATASYCVLIGNNLSTTHSGALLLGGGASSPASYSICQSVQMREANDCRTWRQIDNKRTSDATPSNTTFFGASLPAGKTTSGLLRVKVTALQDGSADGDNSGSYAVGSWVGDIGFRWDGTNGYLYTSSATAGPSAGPTLSLTAVRDDIGVASLPNVAINTGLLRAQVTGKAWTTINWVIEYEVVSTLVS